MKKNILLLLWLSSVYGFSQTNIISTNPLAEQLLIGNYNPALFTSTIVINQHDSIIKGIQKSVNPDSLKSYIKTLATFKNRNTGADTNSASTGIGAARNWVFNQFQQISSDNDNRLISSFLQFNQSICGITQHKNIFAVLPGSDATNHSVILIEGHIDSRCDVACDTACIAEGIEDNASGTALVIELARVMSKFTFKNTIVFVVTIGEEQGLFGANAFAEYALTKNIPIEAVFNNDVIGGVICGQTSSPPSCPGLNDIDSTQVRLFSSGSFNSKNKQLSRYIKLQYKEELLSLVSVPMMLTIMSAEDRTGRGGDHIPFRQRGFAAMRFTSANEHGDASNGPGYTDRQHTSGDILGIDTNNDNEIDSFYVDFNYLARNAVINGVAAAAIAIGPIPVTFSANSLSGNTIEIIINSTINYPNYRVAIRSTTNDWDSVYTFNTTTDTIIFPQATTYFVSVASVDSNSIESLFSNEILITTTGVKNNFEAQKPMELLQNVPNPFDEVTTISVKINNPINYKTAFIVIRDVQGKIIKKLPIKLTDKVNEVNYEHGYGKVGIYSYSLLIDGIEVDSKKMIFAN